uniref:Cytochrome c oxidase subunit 3 n=1 Tax=Unionicola parkeri TaxID=350891 RepID=E3W3L8_9ACAR|nr:cytochrome c oxidase subunit III [Unionicola parkeri]ADP01828.1 cytochrome oxidase subunit 3 [Unionicola parkeri]
MKKFHPFHMVTESPWPIMSSISAMSLTHSMIMSMQFKSSKPLMISFLCTILCATQWWRDVFRESSMEGAHMTITSKGLKLGMILFIVSEVLFFFSFFWSFFQSSLAPNSELGMVWPPMGINLFDPFNIPLLNTIILLSSGVSITWAHHSLLKSNYNSSVKSMIMTIVLGIYFTCLQSMEYWQAPFSMWDSVCGSTFFVATGFHGLHVIIGTTFLIISMNQILNKKYSKMRMISMETAAWYWHFVDVVWLLLYSTIYWWSSTVS